MADFAFYWPQYPAESGAHGHPIVGWNTRREWLYNRVQPEGGGKGTHLFFKA